MSLVKCVLVFYNIHLKFVCYDYLSEFKTARTPVSANFTDSFDSLFAEGE